MSPWHHEQSYPNSCVPACMCMVQKMRGQGCTEEAFHQGAFGDGHPLASALALPRTRRQPLAVGEEEELNLALHQGQVILVSVSGPPFVRWLQAHHAGLSSRHGVLCNAGTHGRPFHAIVLIAWRNDGYDLLDPYHPGASQPLWMDASSFASCFAGDAIFVDV